MKRILTAFIACLAVLTSLGQGKTLIAENGVDINSLINYQKEWAVLYGDPLPLDEYGGTVTFQFSAGIAAGALKTKMEKNLSALLTAINTAARANTASINYTGIGIDPLARQTINMTWNSIHFTTDGDEIVENCLTRKSGYQVRNIPVFIIPIDDTYGGSLTKELAVDFDRSGNIVDVNFTMDKTNYVNVMKEGLRLKDEDRRRMIIDWCEQFEKAYCDRDINFMEDVFSDDALIITGRLTRERTKSDIGGPEVTFTTRSKKEYLDNLKNIFKNKTRLKVTFDDYRVARHPTLSQWYGVTLHQSWKSTGYNDEGTVFLLWDFTDEDRPKIHVRTWEPTDNCSFSVTDFNLSR